MAVIMPPSGGDAERQSPLGLEPGGLWSLLDVIEKYAALFAQASSALVSAESTCFANMTSGTTTKETRARLAESAQKAIDLCRIACEKTGMSQVIPELDRAEIKICLMESYDDCNDLTVMSLISAIRHLIFRINDELNSEFFLHVQRSDSSLYGKKELLGPLVSRHFPNSTSDIEAAGNCLALRQPTACVFHLMRVMEKGTQKLGRKLKVVINPEIETWNKILNHVNKQIDLLPTATEKQKAKKAAFAEVSSYLHQAKIAWRNEVMHPKATYTQEEARDVFAASRTFMVHLSGVL